MSYGMYIVLLLQMVHYYVICYVKLCGEEYFLLIL